MHKKHSPLAPLDVFLKRLFINLFIGLIVLLFSLGIGMMGYSYFENMGVVDAYENAAMILSGMGPVLTMKTVEGKLFAATFALFSGLVFLVIIAIIISPILHRFFHHFLLKDSEE